jgi:phage tail P2-like protein
MNNSIYTADLLRTLPPNLQKDERMKALASVIADELHNTLGLVKENIIYPRINELSEEVLDVLSYDLHVDWYDYNYPVTVKRAVVKDSVKVHMRLGTKYAVVTALGNLHPESEVEEWFEYDGQPFYFRIILDVTNSQVPASYSEIIKAVNFYKSLRSKLEEGENGIIYRSRAGIEIKTAAGYKKFTSGLTGQRTAGTFPKRNIIGVVHREGVTISGDADGNTFTSPLAGTVPVISTIGLLEQSAASMSLTGGNVSFNSKLCGTAPGRL